MAANERQIVREAAQRAGIAPRVLWGVYGTETSFGKDLSRSSAGAEGPFQFMPGTARSLGVNPHDFRSAAFGAAKYLAQFKGRGLAGMLSAYNAGPAGGMQPDYVRKVEANARAWGTETGGSPGSPATGAGAAPAAPSSGSPGQVRLGIQQQGPDPQLIGAIEGMLRQSQQPPAPLAAQASPQRPEAFAGPRLPQGAKTPPPLAPPPEADPASKILPLLEQLTASQGSKVVGEGIEGATAPSSSGPQQALTNAVPHGTKLRGFLPGDAQLKISRIDQGQDVQTNAGGPILAPGSGYVIDVKTNPGGFGNNYPIVHFTSGPLAGHDVYIGHTHAALPKGAHFGAGTVLSRTGHGTAAEGNARTPGWAEIGLWPPGNMEAGKRIAPLLGLR